MKIKFDKLETSNESIKVSFNGGTSYENFGVDNIRKRGIILDDSQNYGKIRIVGKSTVLKNLDVVKDICIPNKTFFLVDTYNNGGGRWDVKSVRNLVETPMIKPMPEAELSFDAEGEMYEDYPSKEDDLPRINASGIMVSILWLQDVFGIESFDAECLVNEYNEPYRPFGYLQDGQPLLYVFDIYNHSPIIYNDGTTQKYFYPSLIESENIAKELPTLKILLEDETVLEEKTIYIDYIRDKFYPIIDDRPDDFSGYDWEVFRNIWEDYDEETDSYTESFQHYFMIEDRQVNVWDSLWLDNDLTLRICNKQEHVYHYNAQYVDDQSKFSVSFTKSNPVMPAEPSKPFATFLGWYQDSSFYTPLNLGDIDSDSYIYAKWEYHDVTRTVYFMYKDQRFEIDLTRKSNESVYINTVLNNLKSKYTGFSTLSSNYGYNVYFNSDEDLDITQYVNNISVKSFTNTYYFNSNAVTTSFFTENLSYYGPLNDTETILDKLFNKYPKSAFQNYKITQGGVYGTKIDSFENLEELRTQPNNKDFYFTYGNYVDVQLIYDNYVDNQTALDDGLPEFLTNNGLTLKSGYYAPDVYVSLEKITDVSTAIKYSSYTLSISSIDIKSKDTLNVLHIYVSFSGKSTDTWSLTSNVKNKQLGNINPDGYTLPSTITELAEFINESVSTITKDTENPDEVPEEGTYGFFFTYNNKKYLPGETLNIPIIRFPFVHENLYLTYYAIPINYNTQATLKTKDLFGNDDVTETSVRLLLNDDGVTDISTDLETPYSLSKLYNCNYSTKSNTQVSLYKTYLDKSINVEFLDNQTRNCFGGIGDTSTEENINKILAEPKVYASRNLLVKGDVLLNILNYINNNTTDLRLSTKNVIAFDSNRNFYLGGYNNQRKPVFKPSNLKANSSDEIQLDYEIKSFIKIGDTYYNNDFSEKNEIVPEKAILKYNSIYKLAEVPFSKQIFLSKFFGPTICEESYWSSDNATFFDSTDGIYVYRAFKNWAQVSEDNAKTINQAYVKCGSYLHKVSPNGNITFNSNSDTSSNGYYSTYSLCDYNNYDYLGRRDSKDSYVCLYNGSYVWSTYYSDDKSNLWGSACYIKSATLTKSGIEIKCGDYLKFRDSNGNNNNYWLGSNWYVPGGTIVLDLNSFNIVYDRSSSKLNVTKVPETLIGKRADIGLYFIDKNTTKLVLDDFNGSFDDSLFTAYPNLSEIVIPNGITEIDEKAFAVQDRLTTIVIPEGVTSINESTFDSCSNLENVYLPKSINTIGITILHDTSATLHFAGSEDEWNQVEKESDWNKGWTGSIVFNSAYTD